MRRPTIEIKEFQRNVRRERSRPAQEKEEEVRRILASPKAGFIRRIRWKSEPGPCN